jgi:hypothetical protein
METIDRVMFRAKHWEVFLIFVALTFVETILGMHLYGVVLLMYLILLGVRLRDYLPPNFQGAYRTFRVAGVLCLVLLIYITGFRTFERDPTSFFFAGGIFLTYVIVLSFVARGMKAIETGDNSLNFQDYILEVILFAIFFPLGLWFIQPRLNRLGERFK